LPEEEVVGDVVDSSQRSVGHRHGPCEDWFVTQTSMHVNGRQRCVGADRIPVTGSKSGVAGYVRCRRPSSRDPVCCNHPRP
jgi:hypothetical protein